MDGVNNIISIWCPLANQKIVHNQSLRLERFNGLHRSVKEVNFILILLLLRLEVKCLAATQLNMVPITLNPHIEALTMRNTEVVRLDDSFQFYEALLDLDLSFNRIRLILDKSFVSQVIKQSQTELIQAGLDFCKNDISDKITPAIPGPQQYREP